MPKIFLIRRRRQFTWETYKGRGCNNTNDDTPSWEDFQNWRSKQYQRLESYGEY